MKYLWITVGALLLVRGIRKCATFVQTFPSQSLDTAYSIGFATGQVVGIILLLLGGVGLIKYGWQSVRSQQSAV